MRLLHLLSEIWDSGCTTTLWSCRVCVSQVASSGRFHAHFLHIASLFSTRCHQRQDCSTGLQKDPRCGNSLSLVFCYAASFWPDFLWLYLHLSSRFIANMCHVCNLFVGLPFIPPSIISRSNTLMPQSMSSPMVLSLLNDFHYLSMLLYFCQHFFLWNFFHPTNYFHYLEVAVINCLFCSSSSSSLSLSNVTVSVSEIWLLACHYCLPLVYCQPLKTICCYSCRHTLGH